MICRQRLIHLLLALLLLQTGCTTGLQAITAPNLKNLLTETQPIRLVTPLASVYSQILGEEQPTIPARSSSTFGNRIQHEILRQLEAKGWPFTETITMDWRNISAERELAADRIMRQLEEIGRQLRYNERIEGIAETDQRVTASDSRMLAANGSLLFAVAIGCDGYLSEGPCREIQSPPLLENDPRLGLFRTIPAGMALHLYWVDAASGQLLWYDTTRSFNAETTFTKNITTMVAETLSEFPTPP